MIFDALPIVVHYMVMLWLIKVVESPGVPTVDCGWKWMSWSWGRSFGKVSSSGTVSSSSADWRSACEGGPGSSTGLRGPSRHSLTVLGDASPSKDAKILMHELRVDRSCTTLLTGTVATVPGKLSNSPHARLN